MDCTYIPFLSLLSRNFHPRTCRSCLLSALSVSINPIARSRPRIQQLAFHVEHAPSLRKERI
jgi:hypothetical protein